MSVYSIQFINYIYFSNSLHIVFSECRSFVKNLSFLLHIASDTEQYMFNRQGLLTAFYFYIFFTFFHKICGSPAQLSPSSLPALFVQFIYPFLSNFMSLNHGVRSHLQRHFFCFWAPRSLTSLTYLFTYLLRRFGGHRGSPG